jgi:hypothetical protein
METRERRKMAVITGGEEDGVYKERRKMAAITGWKEFVYLRRGGRWRPEGSKWRL